MLRTKSSDQSESSDRSPFSQSKTDQSSPNQDVNKNDAVVMQTKPQTPTKNTRKSSKRRGVRKPRLSPSQESNKSLTSQSLGDYNPDKKAKKNKPGSHLFGSLSQSIRHLVDFKKVADKKDTPTSSPKVIEEEILEVERKPENAFTIPLYRQVKEKTEQSSLTSRTKVSSKNSYQGHSPVDRTSVVESNSDDYDPAKHIEILMSKLSNNENHIQQSNTRVHIFDPEVLGREEQEFCETRFNEVVRGYIPQEVPIPTSADRMISLSRRGDPWGYNCGVCSYLKLFIVVSLTLVIVYYLGDPCFFHITLNSEPSTNNTTDHSSTNSNESAIAVQCVFKLFYMTVMGLVIVLFVVIFFVYTCGLVVRYHNFGWFLFEAVNCFVLFVPLFICSVVSLALTNTKPVFVITIVMVDSIFVVLIGLWTFNKRYISDPLYLMSLPGFDMDEITQILAQRQFSKLFDLGKVNNAGLT